MKRKSILLILAASAVALFANPPVDYSVYFDPQPASPNGSPVTPIRMVEKGKSIERVYGIMYDVGETTGSHSYKYTLRVSGNGGVLCESSAIVPPFGPKNTSRRIAYFEAVYPREKPGLTFPKQSATRYNIVVSAIEQVPSGQTAQDAFPGNNTYPNSSCCMEVVDVRSNVESTRCGVMPLVIPHL